MRRLILWTANAAPLMRLDPYPPPDEYRTLRPSDRRNMPPVELLPMIGDDTLLAIVFPYVPLGCQTSLSIELPSEQILRSAVDLWSGRDWTDRVEQRDGVWRIPLDIPGDLEFLALSLACEEL